MAESAACDDDTDLKDRGVLVKTFWDAVDHGAPRLQSIPALIKKILETGAWRRRMHNGKLYEHERFLDFLTAKPQSGCGYDPAQIEKLIESDTETLGMWRKAVTAPAHVKRDDNYNVIVKPQQGNSRAYTVDRLSREAPGLYQAVVRGELSANRAAIEAGFRKPPKPFDQIRKLLPKLTPAERLQLKDLLND
jgi:hypothetical protein